MVHELIINFLKENKKEYSATQISEALKLSSRQTYHAINRLVKDKDLLVTEGQGKNNKKTCFYSYNERDLIFDIAKENYLKLFNENVRTYNGDAVRQFMIISELKKLNKLVKEVLNKNEN